MECIFCNIAKKKVDAAIVYEDKDIIAFKDIHPLAPVHILIIPKKHIASINDVEESDAGLLGNMIIVGKKLAKRSGYRRWRV